jgi:hypothetical protein
MCVETGGELLKTGALNQFRKEVDFLEKPFLQVLTGYNMLIDGILEEIFKLVNPLHSIDIGIVLGFYNSFLYLKVQAKRGKRVEIASFPSTWPAPAPAISHVLSSCCIPPIRIV